MNLNSKTRCHFSATSNLTLRVFLCFVFCAFLLPLVANAQEPAEQTVPAPSNSTKLDHNLEPAKQSGDVQPKTTPEIPKNETKQNNTAEPAPTKLAIGSKAPPLAIEHWLSDGAGKYPHTTEFEPGKVYVIEFWATWCQPCLASIPHLIELQSKYDDQRVQIISVSDESLEDVTAFLDRTVKNKEITYAEFTKMYCLTTDPDGSVSNQYLDGLEIHGIPAAVIVGKDGLIEWLGHPLELENPLRAIVDDRWDRAAYQESLDLLKLGDEELFSKFMENVEKAGMLAEEGEIEEAFELLDQKIEQTESEPYKQMYRIVRHQFAVIFLEADEAVAAINSLINDIGDDPDEIGNLFSVFYSAHDEKSLAPEVLKVMRDVIEGTIKTKNDSFMIHFVYAHALRIDGEVKSAIKALERAIALLEEYETEDEEDEQWIGELSEEFYGLLDSLKENH